MSMQPIIPLPAVQIECAGVMLDRQSSAALDDITIVQRLGLPTQCEITFRDPPGPLTVQRHLTVGQAFRVVLKDNRDALFTGQVTAVEQVYSSQQERILRVRGYDLLHALRKRQTVRAHVQVTLRDLASQLVSDLGLTVSAEQDSPVWSYLIQGQETDFDLLARLGERCGLYFTLRDNVLHLVSLAGMGAHRVLTWRENLHSLSVLSNGDRAAETITTTGWNTSRMETHNRQISTARVHTMSLNGVTAGQVGGFAERFIIDANAPDLNHIEALAQSALDEHTASNITLSGTADGDPLLRPGALIQPEGIDPAIGGRYTLTEATHVINRQYGYITSFATTPPANLTIQSRRSTIVTYGVVTAIDDPENLGRVRVSLPTFNDVQTDWMGVLSPGAGESKGIMTLPDVNDRVLLLLVDGDPARGIVLGGLYGVGGWPDHGIEEGQVRRSTWLTRGGQRIQMDDTGQIMRLENSDGSSIEMAPGGVVLHANTDLTLRAPGRRITIEGQHIDFVRG